MSESKIDAAFRAAYVAAGVIPVERTAFEGAKFTPPSGQSWARLTNLPSSRTPFGLSPDSSEISTGIMQIDVFRPVDTGSGQLLADAEQIMAIYPPRTNLLYQGQRVEIRRTERGSIRADGAWMSIPVSIYYLASIAG